MTGLSAASFVLTVLFYVTATTLYYLEVARGGANKERFRSLTPWLLVAGATCHLTYVLIASLVQHVCPIHSVHFFLSIASLIATGAYLIARRRFRIHALGLIVAPLGLVVTLGTFFLGEAGNYQKLPASFIGLHVFAILVGYAMFLLACGAAIMYLLQEKRLKNKKTLLMSGGSGLPPLDSLDKAIHRFLLAGFPLLTLGVATGTVSARALEAGSPDEVLRTVFGYATWLLIAGVLLLRVAAGWRGRRAAYGTVAGFACALVVLVIYLVRPMLRGA